MNNFFTNNNYSRTYSKGKSFKFSVWNSADTYNNDEFIQDFVQYDRKLWACVSKTPLTNICPSEGDDRWELVLEGVSDVEFKQTGNNIQWKYEDDSEWRTLFELSSVTEEEIKEMLEGLDIEPGEPDENLEQFKKEIIDMLDSKVDKVPGKQLSTNDFTIGFKAKLETLENYDDSNIKNQITVTSNKVNKIGGDLEILENSVNDTISEISKVVDKAPEHHDTLKELSDSIQQNEAKIDNLVATENLITADKLEERLDDIQAGDIRWEDVN